MKLPFIIFVKWLFRYHFNQSSDLSPFYINLNFNISGKCFNFSFNFIKNVFVSIKKLRAGVKIWGKFKYKKNENYAFYEI